MNIKLNVKRRIGVLWVIALSFTLFPINVHAAERSEKLVKESLLTDLKEVEDTTYSLTRGNILNKGTAKCVNAGDGKVTAAGVVVAHQICDELYLTLSLDKYDETTKDWYTYKTWEVSETNASMLLKSFDIEVDKGYYYRVRGVHSAEKGEIYESVDTCTDGILIK